MDGFHFASTASATICFCCLGFDRFHVSSEGGKILDLVDRLLKPGYNGIES